MSSKSKKIFNTLDSCDYGDYIGDWFEEKVHDAQENEDEQNEDDDANAFFYSHSFFRNEIIHQTLYLDLLKVNDLHFSSLPLDKQIELIETIEIKTFQPGSVIINEGDISGHFCILLSQEEGGKKVDSEVEVLRKSNDGKDIILTHLRTGNYFGQRYFVTSSENIVPRNATIKAITKSGLLLSLLSLYCTMNNLPITQLLALFIQSISLLGVSSEQFS